MHNRSSTQYIGINPWMNNCWLISIPIAVGPYQKWTEGATDFMLKDTVEVSLPRFACNVERREDNAIYFQKLLHQHSQSKQCICRGIKLISQSMKLWERVVERRLRSELTFSEQQYGFMPGKSSTDSLFALRVLMEKYREGQKELHCVFVDLEKAYDKMPREEVWYCMRKSGLAEKCVRIVQDMYDDSITAVRCAVGLVGVTQGFEVKVGLHQGSALSPCLFAMVMDMMTDDIREEAPWTMMFTDDIDICSESKERVEEKLEIWRYNIICFGEKRNESQPEKDRIHVCE